MPLAMHSIRRGHGPRRGPLYGLISPSLAIGPDAEYQGANTGVFQNRIMPSGTAIWAKGRHSVAFGGSWSYTQLNTRDHRTGTGNVDTPDFVTFANNWVTPYTTQLFTATTFLQGNADRYYRANETGLFVQDKFQVLPTLEHHRRRALRLGRRTDGKKRQHLQLRSQAIQLRCGVGHHHEFRASSLPATTPMEPQA